VPLRRKDLDLVFSLQHERIVARDNTVSFANKIWQLERSKLRATLFGCRVTIHQHLDETISITLGPHLVGRYNAAAVPSGQKPELWNAATAESDQEHRFPSAAWKSHAQRRA